ncbi:hypothetical protein, partial [Zavarzinella formosa]|uniref:hypothetical protein n=1 Tax=Zavarzinella formosa TaxID=360055 RepID=UPI0005944099
MPPRQAPLNASARPLDSFLSRLSRWLGRENSPAGRPTTRLEVRSLEQRNPPSEALGSMGAPVFVSAFSLIGFNLGEHLNPGGSSTPARSGFPEPKSGSNGSPLPLIGSPSVGDEAAPPSAAGSPPEAFEPTAWGQAGS